MFFSLTRAALDAGDGPLGIKFGKQRVSSNPEWQAVCVARLIPGQQACRVGGLRPGMAVLAVNGEDVRGLDTRDVMRALTHQREPTRGLSVTFGWPTAPSPSSPSSARP